MIRSAVSGKTDALIVAEKTWQAYKRCGTVTGKLAKALEHMEKGRLRLIEEAEAAEALFTFEAAGAGE